MRVIAGEFKGRKLKAVPGDRTRPTTDKVKESMFNIIGPFFDGGYCLDMYSGSGSLAIEAVSRGVEHAFLSEKNRKALQVIRENIQMTKKEEDFTLFPGDSHHNLKKISQSHPDIQFRLVFLDPPYQGEKMEKDILMLIQEKLINDETTIVCEMDKTHTLPEEIMGFQKMRRSEYGTMAVEIFEVGRGSDQN